MNTQSKSGTRLSRTLHFISGWPGVLAVLAMLATVIIGVVSRYAFGKPLHFVNEYNGFFNVAVVFLPLAWVLTRAEHIRLDIVIRVLPRRAVHYLEIVTLLVSLAVIIVLVIGTTNGVIDSFANDRRSWGVMLTPLGPIELMMPVGLSLLAIQTMVIIANRIKGVGHATV